MQYGRSKVLPEAEGRWPHTAEISGNGTLADRTLVLARTPAGTVFKSPGVATFMRGTFDWKTSFGRSGDVDQIVERTIAENRASGAYLRPDDVVTILADRLGLLDNRVE